MVLPGRVGGGAIPAGRTAQSLSITVTPSPLIVAMDLQSYGNSIRSFHEPLKRAIQQVAIPSFRKNFDVGGRPPWPSLAEYTQNEREAQGYGRDRPILVRTGRLKRVATQFNIWRIEGGYRSSRGRAYVQGLPGAEYGAFHQAAGGVAGRMSPAGLISGDIPQRPFLILQPEDRKKIEQVFEKWHDERARRHMKLRPGMF